MAPLPNPTPLRVVEATDELNHLKTEREIELMNIECIAVVFVALRRLEIKKHSSGNESSLEV